MPAFSESLTVRILGDSSHLQSQLEGVTRQIATLRGQLAQLSTANQRIAASVERIAGAVRPLQAISTLVNQISVQVQTLSRIPISFNVRPALNSLQILALAIDAVAGRLRALFAGALFPFAAAPAAPVQGFAQGGLVTGPLGIDRVPAALTAGEFVVRRPAVDRLGIDFLNSLNQLAAPASSQSSAPSQPGSPSTVNNFGGITLNVSRPVDINGIIRDLRIEGFQLRNRRG